MRIHGLAMEENEKQSLETSTEKKWKFSRNGNKWKFSCTKSKSTSLGFSRPVDQHQIQAASNSGQQLNVIEYQNHLIHLGSNVDSHTFLDDPTATENIDHPLTCNTVNDEVEMIGTVDNVKIIGAVTSVEIAGNCKQAEKRKLDNEDIECSEIKARREVEIKDDSGLHDDNDTLVMKMSADISDIVDQSTFFSKQLTFDNATQQVINVMPNVDPRYIQQKIMLVTQRFPNRIIDINIIINELFDESNLPQKRLNNQEMKDFDILEASKMTASDFLEKYADPHRHFCSIRRNVSETYKLQATHHLNRLYSIHGEDVQQILESNNFHLFPTVLMLETRDPGPGKHQLKPLPDRPDDVDPLFVEEVVYCRLACYVRQHQKKMKDVRKKKLEETLSRGETLVECSKCLADCLMEEVIICKRNHPTCRTCLMNLVEQQETYEGQIRCECSEVLPSNGLEEILPSRMVDQLERQFTNQCPLCSGPGLQRSRNVFVCTVAECGKEICKLCWRENHPNKICGDEQGNNGEENDMFSLIGQLDEMTKQGEQQIFYRKKLEASGRRKINSTDKFESLYRLAEGHYHKMMSRDTYSPTPKVLLPPNFISNIPNCKSIAAIEIVVNKELEGKFKRQKDAFKKEGLPHEEILAFHGTNQQSADSILFNNFCMDNVKHGQIHGRGVYFSEFPNFARRYGEVLLLCRVLAGHEYLGPALGVPVGWNSKKVRPSADQYGEQILVDNVDQILPAFAIYINNFQQQNIPPQNVQKLNVQPQNFQQINIQPQNFRQVIVQPQNAQSQNFQQLNVQPQNVHLQTVQQLNTQPSNLQLQNKQPQNIQPLNFQQLNFQPQNFQQMSVQLLNMQQFNVQPRSSQ